MIEPTIGRVVLYHPAPGSSHGKGPLPALVCAVWNSRLINIGGFDAKGTPISATSVQLLQDDDKPTEGGNYAEWMPYQKDQAAKFSAK